MNILPVCEIVFVFFLLGIKLWQEQTDDEYVMDM